MRKRLKITAGIFAAAFGMLLGCERKEQGSLLLPVYESESEEGTPDFAGSEAQALQGGQNAQGAAESSAQSGGGVSSLPAGAEGAGGAGSTQAGTGGAGSSQAGAGQPVLWEEELVVHICGAVRHPGVYTMDAGSRIYQAVEMAGGFDEDAAEDYLNQADLLLDGMKVYVPTNAEVEASGEEDRWKDSGVSRAESSGSGTSSTGDSLLVNINTAGEELLCTLPGIGSSKAKSIIAYREKNGAYQKIEDIMNVEGIKDGLFQKIKDGITVR